MAFTAAAREGRFGGREEGERRTWPVWEAVRKDRRRGVGVGVVRGGAKGEEVMERQQKGGRVGGHEAMVVESSGFKLWRGINGC